MQFEVLWCLDFSYSSLHHIFESKILGFQFFFIENNLISRERSGMWKIKLQQNEANLLR